MKISVITLCVTLLFVMPAFAQETADPASSTTATPAVSVANPFDLNLQSSSMESMGMGSGYGMDMGTDTGMDTVLGSSMMGRYDIIGDEPPISDEKLFRYRLRTAISQISEAKGADEKAALLKYTQTALQEQYDAMIARRTKDVDRLKERLAKLDADLQKRAAAKDRVVKLQMQSVILAAEGLLDLNGLQSGSSNSGGMSDGYGSSYGN